MSLYISILLLSVISIEAIRVYRYQSGNQNPHINEQTTHWPKKVHKEKQRSTKHTYKTKDRITQI